MRAAALLAVLSICGCRAHAPREVEPAGVPSEVADVERWLAAIPQCDANLHPDADAFLLGELRAVGGVCEMLLCSNDRECCNTCHFTWGLVGMAGQMALVHARPGVGDAVSATDCSLKAIDAVAHRRGLLRVWGTIRRDTNQHFPVLDVDGMCAWPPPQQPTVPKELGN